ncbi:MAG: glycogen/starch synthase [Infirmifilum sp.]
MALNGVWMITFEAAPFTKVGGLAEVPTNLSLSLVKRGVSSTIIMPSHTARLEPTAEVVESGVNERRYTFEKINYKGVTFLRIHSKILDDPRVYSEDTLIEKIVDFSIAFGQLLSLSEELGLNNPDIMHFHDWHSILQLLKAKEQRKDEDKPLLVYHVHLLIRRKLDFQLLEAAGLKRDWVHRIYLNGKSYWTTLSEVFTAVDGVAEKLGLAEADRLVTVSRSYLQEDLRASLGEDVLKRGAFVYNGTDWNYADLLKEVDALHGLKIREAFGGSLNRLSLRKYLLLNALNNLPEDEPKVPDPQLKKYILERVAPPFKDNLKIEPFLHDGPLIITTGRLARQKGFDTLAESIEILLREFGETRILFLVLPVWGGERYIDMLIELSREYPHNVRVVFGAAPSIYKLAHLSADVFAAPSRWEPFGIMAIEAMAAGCPVVATRIGGLKETVLDIHEHGIKGTGLHVQPDNPYDLADALRDMLGFMEASNTGRLDKYVGRIGDTRLVLLLEEYLDAGEIIRKNAIDRVSTLFTWEKSAEMLLEVYTSMQTKK